MNKISKKEKSSIAAQLGRLGGESTLKKLGKEHMSKIGLKGVKKRWKQYKEDKKVANEKAKKDGK